MSDAGMWRCMYLGAFAALLIPNVDAAEMLAEQTRSDSECFHAIGVMRRATPGDRVWPALEALREIRKAERPVAAP